MCGIIGYIGKDNAIDYLHLGLKKLEYRGYDSAGISFFENGKLKTIKTVGTVEKLFNKVKTSLASNIGIGHTRWATHGKASTKNSHPHNSHFGKISLVHNGIVENYKELKNTYLNDIEFKSETDTEVVANLLEFFYIKYKNKIKAIYETTKIIKGSFALGIIFADEQDAVYFAKKTSPLCIGICKNGTLISSDILGFCGKANKCIEIKDDEFGKICDEKVEIYDINLNKVDVKAKPVSKEADEANKNGYSHYMLKEIYEVPKTILDTTKIYLSKNNPLNSIDEHYFDFVERIRLVACGTSYHACLAGEKILKDYGFDATSDIASEFIYSSQVLSKNTLCVFVSQSGETADTLNAVRLAKKYGAKTIGITNVLSSNITKLCDYVLPIKCGAEIAVASTKAYNGQLVALITLAEYLKQKKEKIFEKAKVIYKKNIYQNLKNEQNLTKKDKKWQKNIKKMQKLANFIDILNFENQIKNLIGVTTNANNVFLIGKDLDYVTALESALKIKEISYINATAYASGELKHGTIALVDSNTLIFAFITQKKLANKTINIIKQAQSRGAKIVVITAFEEVLNDDTIDYKIALPKVDENLYCIISIIPMQLLAYEISTTLGYNPDKPRNLAKSVTVE